MEWKLIAGIAFVGAGIVMILSSSFINIGKIFEFPLINP